MSTQPQTEKKQTVEERVKELREQLTAGLASLKTEDDWKQHLSRIGKPGPLSPLRYSFGNQMLLLAQADDRKRKANQDLDITAVATFKGWQDAGRSVRAGEKALWILRPSIVKDSKRIARLAEERKRPLSDAEIKAECTFPLFRAMPVFCISQTDGEAIPETTLPDVQNEGWAQSCEALRSVALSEGVPSLDFRARTIGDPTNAYGWCNLMTRAIVVLTDGQTRAEQFTTAVHEVAHALLHCGKGHNPHERASNEVEAESIAFMVCGALGLDTGPFSFRYVAQWATGEDPRKQVEASGRVITATACKILNALAGIAGQDEAADQSAA